MNEHQFRQLYSLYQQNPYVFPSDLTDQVQQQSELYRVPFVRNHDADEVNLLSAVKQFGAGFISGFTTLDVGDDPEGVVDGIARSIGTLMGFVGFIPGPGLIGKFAATAIGRSLGLARLARVFGTNARLPIKSVPMLIADKVVARAEAIGGVREFFRKSRAGDAVRAALHLGTASAASAWQQGVDEMMKGFAFGAIEGGGFRAITNFVDVGRMMRGAEALTPEEQRSALIANIAIRGLSSSLYSGLPSTLREEPLPMQVYEYLLGAYFGALEPSYERVRAREFLAEKVIAPSAGDPTSMRERILNVTKAEGFDELEDDVKEQVLDDAMLWWGRQMTTAARRPVTSAGSVVARAYHDVWWERFNEAIRAGKSREEAGREAGADYFHIVNWTEAFERGKDAGMDDDEAFAYASEQVGPLPSKAAAEEPTTREPEIAPPAPAPEPETPTRQLEREESDVRQSVEDHELPNNLRRPLLDFVRQIGRDNPMLYKPGQLVEEGRYFFRLEDGRLATGEDIAKSVIGIFSRHVGRGEEGWRDAMRELEESWSKSFLVKAQDFYVRVNDRLTINEDSGAWRSLRKVWKNQQKDRPKEKLVLNLFEDHYETRPLKGRDLRGNSTDDFVDNPYLDRAGEMVSLSDIEGLGADGRPAYENVMESDRVSVGRLIRTLDAQGTPFFAAVKDKGEMKLSRGWIFEQKGVFVRMPTGYERVQPDASDSDFVHDVVVEKLKEVGEAMERAGREPKIADTYRTNLTEFAQLFQGEGLSAREIQAIYDRWWLNNVAILEDAQGGIPFERMVEAKLKGEGDFILSYGALTKRMQVMVDGAARLSPELYHDIDGVAREDGSPSLRYVIVNATRKGGSREVAEGISPILLKRLSGDGETVEEYLAEHHMDGVFFLRSDVFDRLLKDGGVSAEAGTAKGTVIYGDEKDASGNPLGMLIGKFAYFRADEHVDRAMRGVGDGIHAIMLNTAAKQRGFRKAYDYKVLKDGSVHFYTPGSDNPQPWSKGLEVYDMPVEAMRVNQSVSEDPAHMLEDVRMVRQFMANLMDEAAIQRYMDRYVRPAFEGEAETNELVRRYHETHDEALVERIDPRRMGLQEILDVVTGTDRGLPESPLYRKVWAHILRISETVEDDATVDEVEDLFRGMQQVSSAAPRILSILSERGLLAPVHVRGIHTEAYTSAALRKYIIDRVLRPYADSSGQGILQPMDPWFQHQLKGRADLMPGAVKGGILQPGYFMLGEAARKKKIRWLGGRKAELGEAFGAYLKEQDPTTRKEMEDLLTFAVIRVPADSLSGTRMLKFAGFSGRRGAGITVHNRELIYLGGADLDIDKAFYFQDPDGAGSKPIRDHIDSFRDQWDDARFPGEGVIIDSKADKGLFVRDMTEADRHPISMLDPRLLFRSGRSARRGNKTIGVYAVAARRAQVLKVAMNLPEEAFERFSHRRRGGMNFAADATDDELKVDAMGAQELLGEALLGRDEQGAIKISDTSLGSLLGRVDAYANGRVPTSDLERDFDTGRYFHPVTDERVVPGRARADLWQTLDAMKSFDAAWRDAEGNPVQAPNAWYRSLQMLGRLNYRRLGRSFTGRLEELAPYIGAQWEENFRPRFQRIMELAEEGDPLANEVLDAVLRQEVKMTAKRIRNSDTLKYARGQRVLEREDVTYDHEWQLQQDVADAVSVVHIYDAAKAALAEGSTLGDLRAIGVAVTRIKDGVAAARNRQEDHSALIEEARVLRSALPAHEKRYFDAYMLGTMYPQPVGITFREFMAEREKEWLRDQEIRRQNQMGDRYRPMTREEAHAAWNAGGRKGPRGEAIEAWNRTNQQALGFTLDFIPDASIAAYLARFNEVAQASFKSEWTPEDRRRIGVLADPTFDVKVAEATGDPEAAKMRPMEVAEYAESFLESIPAFQKTADELFDERVVGRRAAEENRRMYEEVKQILREQPVVRDYFEDVFKQITGKGGVFSGVDRLHVSPEAATNEDVARFLRFFVHVGRGNILKSVRGEDGGEKGLPFTQWAHVFFPDTIARWFIPYDLHVGKAVLRPVMTADGIRMQEVRDVFTTFGKAHEIAGTIQQAKSAMLDNLTAERRSLFNWIFDQTEGDGAALFDMAVARREQKLFPAIFRSTLDRFKQADRVYTITLPKELADELFGGRTRVRLTGRELALEYKGGESIINRIITRRLAETRRLLQDHEAEKAWLVTDSGDAYDPSNPASFVNPYLSLRKITDHINRTGEVPFVGVEGLLKISHEKFLREKFIVEFELDDGSKVEGSIRDLQRSGVITPVAAAVTLSRLRKAMPYSQRTEDQWFDPSVYWPHNGHSRSALKKYFTELVKKYAAEGIPEANYQKEIRRLRWAVQNGYVDDEGTADFVRSLLYGGSVREGVNIEYVPPSLRSRGAIEHLPGWDRRETALETYERQAVSAAHNILVAAYGHELSYNFRRNKRLERALGPRNVEPWAKFLDLYFHSILPGPSLYPESWLEDDQFGLQSSPTFKVSDHNVERQMRRIDSEIFGGKLFEGSTMGDPKSRDFQRQFAWLTQLEGKVSMMSLLASTKAMTNNLVGGSLGTVISTGFRHWYRAGDIAFLRTINPEWQSMEDVTRFAEQIGAIESWIVDEVHIPGFFRSGSARRFFDEAMAMIRKDPSVSDKTLVELAKEHGFDRTIFDGAAWFMRSVERRLRRRAAIAHYLKAREALEVNGALVPYDHPWLVDMARKGVQATQFLYDNANRPAFARTNLGRVLTRFQLWTWNSIRLRRDIFAEARDLGFRPGRPEAERFARMAQIDMFVFALAAAFPASLFDNVLPSPWNYVQEFGAFFFGDEEERDRAFFGTIPYPFSPVQVALPPVSRYFTATFSSLLSNEWDRFVAYHVWGFFPFGLAARSVYKTIDSPTMVMENMTGFPLHRIHREVREHREEESIHASF